VQSASDVQCSRLLKTTSGKLTAMGWYCEIVDGRRHGQDARGPLPI
jgi:hypothetical protein